MTYYTINLLSIPGRDARPPADRATLIRAAQARVEALRAAGLPTGHAEQALARLKGAQGCISSFTD